MAGCSETLSCSKSLSHLGVLERSQLTLQFLGIDLSIRLLFSVGHVPPLVSVSPGLVRVTLYVSWGVYRCLQVQILVLRLSHRDPGVTVERHPAAPLAGMGKSIPSCQGEINRVFQPPPELRHGGIPSRGRKQGCFQPPWPGAVAWADVPDLAVMWHGRWYSSTMVAKYTRGESARWLE